MELAVGIIIGGAFGKIVSSLVSDIIMPPIGFLVGGVKFTDLKIWLKNPVVDSSGNVIQAAVTLNIGNFIQSVFDFLVIAWAIFLLVRFTNKIVWKKHQEEIIPEAPSKEVQLLSEIRDLLKEKQV